MGVLTDFLRAADSAVVVRAMDEEHRRNLFERGLLDEEFEESEGEDADPSYLGEGLRVVDGIAATGMHRPGVLPELIAAIKNVPMSPDLVKDAMVWPYGPAPDPYEVRDDDSPWTSGPWVTQFDVDVRDTLATVSDTDIAAVAARWGGTDTMREFGAAADVLQDIVTRLVGFAREAKADDEQLFRSVSL